jgi:hypothetical protein
MEAFTGARTLASLFVTSSNFNFTGAFAGLLAQHNLMNITTIHRDPQVATFLSGINIFGVRILSPFIRGFLNSNRSDIKNNISVLCINVSENVMVLRAENIGIYPSFFNEFTLLELRSRFWSGLNLNINDNVHTVSSFISASPAVFSAIPAFPRSLGLLFTLVKLSDGFCVGATPTIANSAFKINNNNKMPTTMKINPNLQQPSPITMNPLRFLLAAPPKDKQKIFFRKEN